MSFLVEDQFRNMEHLDLAGVMAGSAPPSSWQIPAFEPASAFEQQDAIYLSSSRQMLEPIMEETSEDEESTHNSWTQYENQSVWSSESETGSVIRIELNRDPDSISERDFACPAKRARRDEFIIGGLLTCQPMVDDSSSGSGHHLRKFQRNDLLNIAIDKLHLNDTNALAAAAAAAAAGGTAGTSASGPQRKRFDEFYCDMDSLSCNSLSRSSSLIQFESLERQLLNEQGLCSSLGNSSPSLLSFEGGCIDAGPGSGSNSNRGSTGCLKRYESSDGRLHQTYFDLDKIDFEENLHFTSTAASKSDSESSSDNSVASHKVLSTTGAGHSRAFLKGGKSSAENLSEDSGYCEYIHSVLRAKSKSIPNFEKFCEEDEFYDHSASSASASATATNPSELRKTHSKIQTTTPPAAPPEDAPKIDRQNLSNGGAAAVVAAAATATAEGDDVDDDVEEDGADEEEVDGDCWYNGDKNSRRSPSSSSPISSDESSATTSTNTSTSSSSSSSSCASASSFTWRPAAVAAAAAAAAAVATNKESSTPEPEPAAPLHRSANRSSSLPDIRGEEATFALSPAVGHHQRELNYHNYHNRAQSAAFQSSSTDRVASVPNDLDRIEDHHNQLHHHQQQHPHQQQQQQQPARQRRSSAQRRQPLQRRTLSASSSSDLDEDHSEQSSVVVRSNSWKRSRNSTSSERLDTSQSARSLQSIGSGSGYMNASYNNLTLLDYSGRPRSNRNSLSLAGEEAGGNLKRNSREMDDLTADELMTGSGEEQKPEDEVQHVQLTIRKPPRRNNSKAKPSSKTFDQDPTSMRTSYAQSLEKCNFDPKELSSTDLTKLMPPKRRFHSSVKKRMGLVSSTPNLNAFNHDDTDDDMFVSSAHTSMHQLPINEKRLGILLPAGSRSSFGKGVSFCPVVSKYSWQEQSSEECNDTTVPEQESAANATVVEREHAGEERAAAEESGVTEETAKTEETEERNVEKTSPKEENAIKERITITISSVIATAAPAAPQSASPANSIKSPAVERGSDCYKLSPATPTSNNVAVNTQVPVPVLTQSPRLILSASNRLISEKLDSPRAATPVPQVLHPSSPSDSVNKKMSNYAVKCSAASGESHALNNNNELMKSKFKADEKHPQHKGFLSRFANGFRFSLRRNKKKQQQQQQQQQKELREAQEKAGQLPPIPPSSKKPVQNSPDFIYIPLKGPTTTTTTVSPCNNGNTSPSASIGSNHVLSAKQQTAAPFQKPPRVVGVCEKRAQSASQHALDDAAAPPQSIDEQFLHNERGYYDFKNQLNGNGVMNGNGCNTDTENFDDATAAAAAVGPAMSNNSQHQRQHQHKQLPSPDAMYRHQQQQQQPLNHCKIGLIETNLDTHETKISGKTRSLMELGPQQLKYNFTSKRNTSGYDRDDDDDDDDTVDDDDDDDVDGSRCDGEDHRGRGGVKKSSGVMSGGAGGVGQAAAARRPHKSMEFLLDKENQKNVLPPENELQKSHDNTTRLSEHQLRVQASLQRLNIPDWFRQYNHCSPKSPDVLGCKPGQNNFTRKRTSDSGRWTGLNSKTTSLSSLGSQRSDRSPLLLSPSAHSHHGGQTTLGSVTTSTSGGPNVGGGFSRWSTSYLNSTQTSPSVSTRGSFSRGGPVNTSFISATGSTAGTRNSFRQPYLGWRSQEKLSQPRTPHERLASSLLAQRTPKPEPVTPEIQTSIKEVTSAIVHYVNDQTNRTNQRSRSASPNSRKCWLESSFVGIRPVESPQTPIIDNSTFSNTSTGGLNHSYHNNTTSATSSIHSGIGINNVTTLDGGAGGLRMNGVGAPERTMSSASLEDVLASLLGLPTTQVPATNDTYRSTGDSASETANLRMTSSASPSSLQVVDQQARFRRRSEGDAQRQQQQQQQQQQQLQQQQHQHQQQQSSQNHQQPPNTTQKLPQTVNSHHPESAQALRRISLDSSESKTTSELQIKCRNTKCDQAATPLDAKKFYKSCHNCSHLYCSRECRRAHWEKHRKACLHSRASNLCRQVLSACKDDVDTQRHLSLLARKGYLSQGRGVVRALFRSAEAAEGFIKHGFQCMGEASYVRWPDLMPAEMGLELYSELLKLSTEYKPDSKMLIYVAICVVSEAPGTATAPVKWERQLVSRCAKLKLCKSILTELEQSQQQIVVVPEPATEILILTFNPAKRSTPSQREVILTNILTILNRRGVILRKHYPEIYQRLQTYAEGQTDRFNAVTLHPRDSQTGQGFVCIIMPLQSDSEIIKMPCSDGGNKVSTIDVGEELMES